MKDTVILRKCGAGKSIRFTIRRNFKAALGVGDKSLVEVQIFKIVKSSDDEGIYPKDLYFIGRVSTSGIGSSSIIVKGAIVEFYNLEVNNLLGVDIKIVK